MADKQDLYAVSFVVSHTLTASVTWPGPPSAPNPTARVVAFQQSVTTDNDEDDKETIRRMSYLNTEYMSLTR